MKTLRLLVPSCSSSPSVPPHRRRRRVSVSTCRGLLTEQTSTIQLTDLRPPATGWMFFRGGLGVADEVSLGLSRDRALVLFDWLVRTGEAGRPVGFVDRAEQRVLWDIEAALESLLTESFAADYTARLDAARDRIRDSEVG